MDLIFQGMSMSLLKAAARREDAPDHGARFGERCGGLGMLPRQAVEERHVHVQGGGGAEQSAPRKSAPVVVRRRLRATRKPRRDRKPKSAAHIPLQAATCRRRQRHAAAWRGGGTAVQITVSADKASKMGVGACMDLRLQVVCGLAL